MKAENTDPKQIQINGWNLLGLVKDTQRPTKEKIRNRRPVRKVELLRNLLSK